MFEGKDLVDLAMTRKGQRYVLGARVHLANANWSGPWDCAEFVSWCVYQAYKTVLAVRPPNIQLGESYSGWWYEDVVARGLQMTVREAIATPGAILVRRPGDFGITIGHVAISLGNGSTIEARSARHGVNVFSGAADRPWTIGARIPGVDYAGGDTHAVVIASDPNLLQLASPFVRGESVVAVQSALKAIGIDPGPVDGIYGVATAKAVAAFQAQEGLTIDGIVGPETREALKL